MSEIICVSADTADRAAEILERERSMGMDSLIALALDAYELVALSPRGAVSWIDLIDLWDKRRIVLGGVHYCEVEADRERQRQENLYGFSVIEKRWEPA